MDPNQTRGFLPKTESPVGLALPTARLAAFILDLLILFPLIRILQAPTQRGLMTASLLEDQPGVLSYKLLSVLVFIGVFLAYHTIFIYWRGQTLGKMFFGVQVISMVGPLSFWSALSRAVFLLIGLGMAYLPFLAIFYHPLRRSLHDRIADTLVVGLKEVVSWPQLSERRGAFLLMTSTLVGALIVLVSALFLSISMPVAKSSQLEGCSGLGQNKDEVSLSESLNLFIAGSMTSECLQHIAQDSIWSNKREPLAHLALAFVYKDNPEKSDRYLKSLCLHHAEHRLCRFVGWLTKQTNSPQWVGEGVESLLDDPQLEDFARLFLATYAARTRQPQIAQRALHGVLRPSHLNTALAKVHLQLLLESGELALGLTFFQGQFALTDEDAAGLLYQSVQTGQLRAGEVLRALDQRMMDTGGSDSQRMPASDQSIPVSPFTKLRLLLSGQP